MMYNSVYRPAVEYPLGQSFLSDQQIKQIEKKALPRIIAKCGYTRSISRHVRAGPQQLGGAEFVPLKAMIGSNRVLHFLKN